MTAINNCLVYKDSNLRAPSQLQKEMGQEVFQKNQGYWAADQMQQICPLISEWKVEKLSLICNFQKNIMKEISHINFTKIKMLDVSFNNIDSIEGLNRIHLPTIEVLHLNNNEIAFFQELKKVQFPKLTELRIDHNIMNDEGEIVKLRCPEIVKIIVESFRSPLRVNNISWICKIQNFNLQKIFVMGIKRIHQRRLRELIVLHKKIRINK